MCTRDMACLNHFLHDFGHYILWGQSERHPTPPRPRKRSLPESYPNVHRQIDYELGVNKVTSQLIVTNPMFQIFTLNWLRKMANASKFCLLRVSAEWRFVVLFCCPCFCFCLVYVYINITNSNLLSTGMLNRRSRVYIYDHLKLSHSVVTYLI